MTLAQFEAARTCPVAARRAYLVALLEESPSSASDLAGMLAVSKPTVERDLEELTKVLPIVADPDPTHQQRLLWRIK